jgi:phage terminase large subunit
LSALQFPVALEGLFRPARYKFIKGGRGSGKSWGVARALLIQGASAVHRVLCTREVQKSIKQSVHQLLKDQIGALGLDSFYETLESEIRGKNGTRFYFTGLSDHTSDSIKSFEGCTRVWIEEGQSISAESWKILTPTIRETGSEIWTTYNPQLDTDETFLRSLVRPFPDTVVIEMNYTENPWFPPVLEAERLHAKTTLKPEEYAHIWEGKCRPAVEGAIYYDQIAQATKRIGDVPHDPLLKTHAVWDLGFNDSMAIILAQKVSSELRIIHYIEGTQRTLADYSAELKALRLDDQPINWGKCFIPHDGYAKRHQTGKSDADVLKGLGWEVPDQRSSPIGLPQNVENGIKRAREVFSRVYFNKERTARLVECLKRYRRKVPINTGEPGEPLHDQYSHGADAFRYFAVASDELTNNTGDFTKPIKYPKQGIV